MNWKKVAYMSVIAAAFCVSVTSCSKATKADDDKDDGPFNGILMVSPYYHHSMIHVDDGKNSCYILVGDNGTEKMSCVATDEDRGTDELGKVSSAPAPTEDPTDSSH